MTEIVVPRGDRNKIVISLPSSFKAKEDIKHINKTEVHMNTKLLVASEHRLMRKAIIDILKLFPQCGFYVVAEASNKEELFEMHKIHKPECIILDNHLGPGESLAYLTNIMAASPNTKILYLWDAYFDYKEEDTIYHILYAGGQGLLSKNAEDGELIYALRTIMSGGRYFIHGLSDAELSELERNSPFREAPVEMVLPKVHLLNNREKKLLSLIGVGKSD